MSLFVHLRRQHNEDTTVRVHGSERSVNATKSHHGVVLTKRDVLASEEAARADLEKVVARKKKLGYVEVSRLESSPWVDWLRDFERLGSRVEGDATDIGLQGAHVFKWEVPDYPRESVLDDWRELFTVGSFFRQSFLFWQPGGNRIQAYFSVAAHDTVRWHAGAGIGSGDGGAGVLGPDGVFTSKHSDSSSAPIEHTSAEAFRAWFGAHMRTLSDAWIAGL